MIITNKNTVIFELPQEYQQAMQFGEENKDWKRSESTVGIAYSMERTYSVKLKEDGEE